jgi:hypothetical protein
VGVLHHQGLPVEPPGRSGGRVSIVMLDVPDRRPVEDVLCKDDDYANLYRRAGKRQDKRFGPIELRAQAEGMAPFTVFWVYSRISSAISHVSRDRKGSEVADGGAGRHAAWKQIDRKPPSYRRPTVAQPDFRSVHDCKRAEARPQ